MKKSTAVERIVHFVLGALAVMALCGMASATPVGTLTFITPTGSALSTDPIAVFLELALQSGTGALTTDSSGNVVGLTAGDIQPFLFPSLPAGIDQNSFTNSNLNEFFACSGTFTTGCGGPPYDLNFNFTAPTMVFPANLSVADGSTFDFLFITFNPTGGNAPAGHYFFSGAGVFIQVWDNNPTDELLNGGNAIHLADIPVADIQTTTPGATFSRDVTANTATPEPGTWAFMLTGLALVAGSLRRKA
jgi:hypothetical protein